MTVTRRRVLAGALAIALAPAVREGALAAAGLRTARIHVDVSHLRALRGDPTASWAADDMPGAVARALGPRFARGARGGAALNVHVDDLRLQPMRTGNAPRIVDEISGFVSLSRPGVAPRRRAIRATAVFRPSARDGPGRVAANRRRVSVLVDRFAEQIPRNLGL